MLLQSASRLEVGFDDPEKNPRQWRRSKRIPWLAVGHYSDVWHLTSYPFSDNNSISLLSKQLGVAVALYRQSEVR
jgi:hypothetical protein